MPRPPLVEAFLRSGLRLWLSPLVLLFRAHAVSAWTLTLIVLAGVLYEYNSGGLSGGLACLMRLVPEHLHAWHTQMPRDLERH